MGLMTVAQFRSVVRAHLESDDTELTNEMVDQWLRGGAAFVTDSHPRWPFMQGTWTLSTTASTANYNLTNTALFVPTNQVLGTDTTIADPLIVFASDRVLRFASRARLLRWNVNSSGEGDPQYWSKWDGRMTLYPTPSGTESITVLGYRNALDWVSMGAASTSDLPNDFDTPILYWALGQAYAQQDEPETSVFWLDMADHHLQKAMARHTDAPPTDDFIVGGGWGETSAPTHPSFQWQ